MNKHIWIGLGLCTLSVAALFILNAYTLELTQGTYNAISVLFV